MKKKTERISVRDLSDAIFVPEKQAKSIQESKKLVFTIIGKHQDTVDALGNHLRNGYPLLRDLSGKNHKVIPAEELPSAYAMSVKYGNTIKYYVKRGGDGRLYNPLGIYNEQLSMSSTHSSNSNAVRDGRPLYRFDEVNQKIFMNYLTFLKTRNQAWLTICQRDIVWEKR